MTSRISAETSADPQPSTSQASLSVKKTATKQTIQYLCGICQLDCDDGSLCIICDLCGTWYHISSTCENVSEDIYTNENIDWYCTSCSS